MRIFRFFSIINFLFILYCINPLYSELRKVSLDECINIAIQQHPEIKASDEDYNISQSNYGIAKARNRPIINFELRTIGSNYDELSSQISGNNSVNIADKETMFGLYAGPTFIYNLVDPQTDNLIESARMSVDLSKMRSFKTKLDIILNVKKSYYEYLFANENRIKREQLVEKFKLKLNTAKLLFETGDRPSLDVTKAEVDLADAMLEYERAKNYENSIKTGLLSSMGIFDEDIEFSPIKIEKLPELIPLKKLYQLAELNNPDLRIANINKEINRLNIDVARSAHYPVVDLLGAVGIENSNIFNLWQNPFMDREFGDRIDYENWNKTIYLTLSAKVNIWSGGAITEKVHSKSAEYNKSKYIEQDISIKMKALIRNYFQSISEFQKQIELSELVMENSQKHLKLARKSYENGISTQLDIQDAEMSLLKSELSYVKTRYDYLITLAKLANIIGLDEEYICLK